MHLPTAILALLPAVTITTNILLSNDDGWAEINIRQFYNTLINAGDSVVISAPTENQSGKGLMILTPFRSQSNN